MRTYTSEDAGTTSSLYRGMAKPATAPIPQKTIQPVVAPAPAPVAAPAAMPPAVLPGTQSWDEYKSSIDWNNSDVNNGIGGLAKQLGYSGPIQERTGRQVSMGEGESGPMMTDEWGAASGLSEALKNYRFTPGKDSGGNPSASVYDASGNQVGGDWRIGSSGGSMMEFMSKAIPALVLSGFGAGALGAFGGASAGEALGAATGGADAATSAAWSQGAAGLGGDTLTAMGAGEAATTTAGLGEFAAFNPADFGGFQNVGAAAGEAGAGEALASAPSFFEPGASFLGESVGAAPSWTTGIAGGIEPAALGESFLGGSSFLGEPIASAPGLAGPSPSSVPQAPPYTTAAADSQAANTAMQAAGTPVGAAIPPNSVDLGSLGGGSTAGGITDIASALAAVKSGVSSVTDFAKANPQLAALGASGAATLLNGTGGNPPPVPGSGSSGGSSNDALIKALTDKLYGANGSMSSSFDYSSVPVLQTSAGEVGQFNQAASDAAYNSATRYLDPQIAQQQQALEARLAEQGFVPGTPGYKQAMGNFMDTNQRAYAQARDTATLQGFSQGNNQFNQSLSNANLNNAASREKLAQLLSQRNQPLNELNALKSGQQLAYDNQLGQYNADVASKNSTNQALSQLALALGIYLG
jgi:hypothetical protein